MEKKKKRIKSKSKSLTEEYDSLVKWKIWNACNPTKLHGVNMAVFKFSF